jgi:hypothetical protein
MLGRLASGAQHHLQTSEQSSEDERTAETHAPDFQYQFFFNFLSNLEKQDKMSHACTTTCSILRVSSLPTEYVCMYVCMYVLFAPNNQQQLLP